MGGDIENEAGEPDGQKDVDAGGMTAVATLRSGEANPDVPEIIHAAGEAAVAAYLAFFAEGYWSPSTRKLYGHHARRFLDWAGGRGIRVESIVAADTITYADEELGSSVLPATVSAYRRTLRALFRHLVDEGVRADNPFDSDESGVRQRAELADPEPTIPLAELKQGVRELDNWEEDSEFFQAGLVILAPLSLGTMEPGAISRFTGVQESLVREFAARLQANDVWLPNGKIAMSSDDVESGVLEAILQVLVALGYVECKQSAAGELAPAVVDTGTESNDDPNPETQGQSETG